LPNDSNSNQYRVKPFDWTQDIKLDAFLNPIKNKLGEDNDQD
jgi:hypothetical protein